MYIIYTYVYSHLHQSDVFWISFRFALFRGAKASAASKAFGKTSAAH